MKVNVGVLAIGNEVVEGQITNRNAAWLSEQMTEVGAQPLYHLSCRDQHDEIVSSLNFLRQSCHLVLVSGGLGPTKDDCTRETLSQWLGCPLELNEEEWICIKKKLTDRQLTLREGHKRQAMIPQGATVLPNSKGVAPGFFIKGAHCFLASLPGPPSELHAMYDNHLKDLIVKNLAPKNDLKLQTWVCLGPPESEVAHIVESLMGDDVEIGFRIHKPFVEVKLWLPVEENPSLQKRIELMEQKLGHWLVARSIPQIRQNFHDYLRGFDHVFVIDHLTSGLMLEKLKEGVWSDHLRYQCFEHKAYRHFKKEDILQILKHMAIEQTPNALFIGLFPETDNSALISFNNQVKSVSLPRKISLRSQLGQLYMIESCFLEHQK